MTRWHIVGSTLYALDHANGKRRRDRRSRFWLRLDFRDFFGPGGWR